MGSVRARAVFYNGVGYAEWVSGRRVEHDVRRVEVEALIDIGAAFPALPADLVEGLDLTFLGEVDGGVAGGVAELRLYGPVVVQIDDCIAVCPVTGRPRSTTLVIGVVVLEQTGFRIDPVTGRLVKGLPLMLTQRIEDIPYSASVGMQIREAASE